MRILIIGAGEVGSHLAKMLRRYRHEVVVVEPDAERLEHLASVADILPVRGLGTSPETLQEAGIREADMIIAVTTVDEVNLLACTLANQVNVPVKIARVRNQEYATLTSLESKFKLGIDLMVHPELEAAREIANLVRYNRALDYHVYGGGKIQLIGVKVAANASLVDKQLSLLYNGSNSYPFRVVAIRRDLKTRLVTTDDVIQANDCVYAVIQAGNLERFFSLCGYETDRVRDVMIYGASDVGNLVAKELENDRRFRVKLIEPSAERAHIVAREHPRTLVMHGEGTDIDLLAAEGLVQMDAFVATTENDEKNIVSCLLARHLGVERVITLIGRSEYLPIFRTIGLDIPINLRLITANAILKKIQQGSVISVSTLRSIDAESFEFEILPGSRLIGKRLEDVQLPNGSVICAFHRAGRVMFPAPDFVFHEGDFAVVLAFSSATTAILKLFR
ncbi:MAG: Trk system potassium transporter TrkA [bacterium]|nr:Trk system potassium transporter TrkA [bacterium]